MRRVAPYLVIFAALAALPGPAQAARGSRWHPETTSKLGVVASESPAASRIGRQVLEQGGNAIDAAASMVFALNVARPQSCGIGGGGFLVYRSHGGQVRTLDFRETAPAAIRPDQFVNDPMAAKFTGHTTVGVPGVVAGMDAALSRYGTIGLRNAIAPAEVLAERGIRVPTSLSGSMAANRDRIALFPAAAAQFLHAGQPYAPGSLLVQKQLAATLRRIMRGGARAFYRGTIAHRIVRDMRAPRTTGDPGLMTLRDLAAYRAVWRPALVGSYRGREIDAMGPPTSGGVAILEMLNLLEGYDLAGMGQSSAAEIHTVAEAQRIAWADRNRYLADPDQVDVPTSLLTSKAYADTRRPEIDQSQTRAHAAAGSAAQRSAATDENPAGSTTQIGVIDAKGNAVSLTCTIEQEFGSGVVAPGTGFLLNNELTDFGAPGTANAPAPGKRPRSSMSPTIVAQGGRPILATGGAGGSTIIMGALETILDRVDFGLSLADTVDAERFDDQGSSTLMIEDARVAPAVIDQLAAKGWSIQRLGEYGARPRIQLAGYEPSLHRNAAVSDSRSDHAALAQRGVRPHVRQGVPRHP